MGTEELSDVVAHLVCFCCSYREFERVNSTAIPMGIIRKCINQIVLFHTNVTQMRQAIKKQNACDAIIIPAHPVRLRLRLLVEIKNILG